MRPNEGDTGLVEGTIRVTRPKDKVALYGPSAVKLVRVWNHGEGKYKYLENWLKAHYGDKPVLTLHVGNTPYALLLVDGWVAPLISSSTQVWRIDGLGKDLSFAKDLRVTGTAVELIAGGGDMRSFWKLELGKGLVIQYWEEYDGP
jgi:hypothetical protein